MSGKSNQKSNNKRMQVTETVPVTANISEVGKTQADVMTPKRELASIADFHAAQLHEAKGQIMELRAENLKLRQLLLQKEQVILNLERETSEKEKAQLRKDHGLALGRALHRDDKTGEVYWVEQSPTPQN